MQMVGDGQKSLILPKEREKAFGEKPSHIVKTKSKKEPMTLPKEREETFGKKNLTLSGKQCS